MSEENKELMRRWFKEVWNNGRTDAIAEMFADDGIAYGLSDEAGQPLRGVEGFKKYHATFRGAFPDIVVDLEDIIAEGDKVAARCVVRGNHSGHHLGVEPSKKPIDITGMAFVRVRDGKIVEAWNNFDFMKLYQQIGVI